jgi:hypothetical protein
MLFEAIKARKEERAKTNDRNIYFDLFFLPSSTKKSSLIKRGLFLIDFFEVRLFGDQISMESASEGTDF